MGRRTMLQMATPPIATAAPPSNRLQSPSQPYKVGVNSDGGKQKINGSFVLVEETSRACSTIDELQGGTGADEADDVAEDYKADIIALGNDMALVLGEEIIVDGHICKRCIGYPCCSRRQRA
jgi:hypothetical protein